VKENLPDNSLDQDAGIPVGAALAELRQSVGITGRELGRRLGMSQAKISRIETGILAPDPGDVAQIAETLGASAATIRRLVTQAERRDERLTDWRLRPANVANRQRELAQLEAATRTFRVFQPALIIGLMQTSEYARSVLTTVHTMLAKGGATANAGAVADAVVARIQRQKVLTDSNKRFRFLMSETALQTRVCPPEDMPAQLHRIREVSKQDNVSLAIVTIETQWRFPPTNGFQLLDDRAVLIDLFNTGLISRGRADIAIYRRLFDAIEEQATEDIDPILDRYFDKYVDAMRAKSKL
jgi:transcriptional regulator with XRE-family HTH domain